MEGIANIEIAGDRISSSLVHSLGPFRCSHNNQIIRVNVTDRRNNRKGIGLDSIAPGDIQWFVVEFIDHIIIFSVKGCHFLEKIDCFINMVFSMVGMPVNNYVDPHINRSVHNGYYTILIHRFIIQVSTWVFHAHGSPDDGCIPVFLEPGNHFRCIIAFSAPVVVAPEKTVSSKRYRLTVFIYNFVTIHLQQTVYSDNRCVRYDFRSLSYFVFFITGNNSTRKKKIDGEF